MLPAVLPPRLLKDSSTLRAAPARGLENLLLQGRASPRPASQRCEAPAFGQAAAVVCLLPRSINAREKEQGKKGKRQMSGCWLLENAQGSGAAHGRRATGQLQSRRSKGKKHGVVHDHLCSVHL